MTAFEEMPPEDRRGDQAAWWTVLTATAALIVLIAGVILVAGSRGSGAAPLPPGPVVAASSTSGSTTSSSTPASIAPSSTTPAPEPSTTMSANPARTRPAHPTTTHQTKTRRSTTSAAPPTHRGSPTPGPAPTAAPVRHDQQAAPKSMGANEIRIPVQGVTAPIVGACRVHDGAMDPPARVTQTCRWQRDQVTVITGHVNYVGQGTGALGHIAYLRTGDRVYTSIDGHRVSWTVRDVTAYSKTALPQSVFLSAVYGGPTLRLVTCGGDLLPTGHYADSVVVTLTPEG